MMTKMISCDKVMTYKAIMDFIWQSLLYKRVYGGYGEIMLCGRPHWGAKF